MHAGVRYTNPTTGADALLTIRTELHRLRAGATSNPARVVGSSVWQIFDGEAEVTLGPQRHAVTTGDLFVVPSWCQLTIAARTQLDLSRFSDEPA